MSKHKCCVPGCLVTSKEDVPLHRFPDPETDTARFEAWVCNIGGDIAELDRDTVRSNRRICHKHFDKIYYYPKNRLCKLAIPTLSTELKNMIGTELTNKNVTSSTSNESHAAVQLPIGENVKEFENVIGTVTTNQNVTSSTAVSMLPVGENDKELQKTSYAESANPSVSAESHIQLQQLPLRAPKQLTEYTRLIKQLKKCEKDKSSLQKKLVIAKKLTNTPTFKKLSQTARIFCQMQVSQSSKEKKGRRFSLDEKILSLSLYKSSPRAYRLLRKLTILPSRRTLQTLLHKIKLKPGINNIIFEHLKKRVSKMPLQHRYCILAFDEMAISASVSYDKTNDNIIGFVDNGENKEKLCCDHVLVFMVLGIVKKYKQPISYSYCSGSTKSIDLQHQLKNIIQKLQDTGLEVVTTVCDQGSSNVAAINQLQQDTRRNYLRSDKVYSGGFFEINDQKIFPVFDPPHLMKGIRNNLLTKNLQYVMNGKSHLASWSHVQALFTRSPDYKGLKLVPKLTAQHVIPNLIPKMRVKHCTQVFSHSVGVALGFMASYGQLPKECTDTADLLLLFDRLFDSVNGSYSEVKNGKTYRSAVTPTSPHHKLWRNSLPILKSMKFLGAQKQGVVPSLTSWVKTIEAFQLITKFLSTKGINSLLLRNFNQDAVENFFGAIRSHGYSNIMPNSAAFEGAFKTLLLNNMSSSHSVGANCEKDEGMCLQSIKYLLKENISQRKPPTTEPQVINENHLFIDLLNTQSLIEDKSPVQVERSAAIAYCSGWIANLAKKNVFKGCLTCKLDLETEDKQDFHRFITMKEYENKNWLCYPTRALFEFFAQVEHITLEILKQDCIKPDLCAYIKLIIDTNLTLNLSCSEHKQSLHEYLVNKSVIFFVNNWCKDVNNVLLGKTTFWDRSDSFKNKAHEHFVKNKGRKRKRGDMMVNV